MDKVTGLALSIGFLAMLGCGGTPQGGQPVFETTGTVTMNGKALADATVIFAPQGEQPTAQGKTDADGNFTLTTYDFGDGAAEGDYKVVITKVVVASSSEVSSDDGHEQAEADLSSGHGKNAAGDSQNLVPPQYSTADSTPETASVKADGDNSFTFTLTP